MRKVSLFLLLLLVGVVTASRAADVSFSAWQYFAELSRVSGTGIYSATVPLQVIDKSRDDLADLRLVDSNGREIPYAVRIRRDVDESREISATAFNQSARGTTSEMSVDLGDNNGVHNEVQIETGGSDFRRRVEVEGSDDGKEWKLLKTGDVIFRFQSQNSTVESNRVSYPVSRYRFLRVRVFADELKDKVAPPITRVGVSMSEREQGELTSWTANLAGPQLLRNQGAPASSWTIDLGYSVPCDRLRLEVDQESFSRPFQLEGIDDPQNPRLVTSGELTRRLDEPKKPLVIVFDHEERVRKLRLIVTDYNNQTLSISSIDAAAPARQFLFELKDPRNESPRLFFGNPQASAPHYDFERDLPAKLASPATVGRTQVGAFMTNPDYKPEPLPLTERVPWLIYLVLAASSVALALVLLSLARSSLGGASTKADAEKSTA